MKLTAYTDGAYDKETNRCGFGIEFADEDGNGLNSCYGGFTPKPDENGWNINGELKAAETAVKIAEKLGVEELTIKHDCEGVGKWALKEWKRNKTYTKDYADFMERAMTNMRISFTWVKSHSGNSMNNFADNAAKKGMQSKDDELHWEDPTAWERFVATANADASFETETNRNTKPETGTTSKYGYVLATRSSEEPLEELLAEVCRKAEEAEARGEVVLNFGTIGNVAAYAFTKGSVTTYD